MKISKLKEKLGLKKTDTESAEGELQKPVQKEEKRSYQDEGSTAKSESSEPLDLTEKLKKAFHEKPKEDKELQHRKELDQTIRGFRKSFRQDMRHGAKQIREEVVTGAKTIGGGVVTEVRQTITTIKVATKKRKGKDDDQTLT
nr:hypothetical protein [Candidatus Njordarchaeum guaymaensis]